MGDSVRVTDIESPFYDEVHTIFGIWEATAAWIYNIVAHGTLHSLYEYNLTLADPDRVTSVAAVLDEMDAESKPHRDITEQEIDGDYVRGLGASVPNRRAKTLRTAESLINGDRAAAYGHPSENFGRIAALWNAQFGRKLAEPFTAEDVALALVHLKMSRLANNPRHEDSLIDACGYLALASEIANPDV